MVTFAVGSIGSKDEQLVELSRLASVYGKYAGEDHPREAKDQCLSDARDVIMNKAFAWHREAVGTDLQPGTDSAKTKKEAVEAYEVLLDLHEKAGAHWDEVDQAGAGDTWATPYDFKYYMAELLWSLEDWARCGPAYDEVVLMDPEGEYLEEAAYASALCYTKLYHVYHKHDTAALVGVVSEGTGGGGDLARGKLGPMQEKMLASFKRYSCHVEQGEDLANVMYQMGRVYYESNLFDEAAYWFGRVAHQHVGSDVGPFAANLYLDSLAGIMGQDADRQSPCLERIAQSATAFVTEERFATYLDDPEFGHTVHAVKCNTERKKAEALQDKKKFKQAALVYRELYEKWGQKCGERLDEVLWNMGVNFQAANLLGQAIKWRKVLIERYPDSEHAKKAIYEVGANYHAIAMYEEAAGYYEQFAGRFPGEPEAPSALANALAFRLGLGDYDKAYEDAGTFIKNYSSGKKKKPIEVAKVSFSLGQIHARREDWGQVIKHYGKFVKKHKHKSVIDLRIRAWVAIAGAWTSKGVPEKAYKAYGSASKLFGLEALEWIHGAGDTPEEREADRIGRGGLMLDAASEAAFHLGEREYEKFLALGIPEFDPSKIKKVLYSDDPVEAEEQELLYKNQHYHESVEAWKDFRELMKFKTYSETDLVEWADAKTESMSRAAALYTRAYELGVPRWVIASSARLGDMYHKFFLAIYEAPVPAAIEKDPDAWIEFISQRDQKALPIKAEAIKGYQECLLEATKNQWFNEWSSLCEASLTDLDPKTFPISSELKGKSMYAKEFVAFPVLDPEL
jgi:tetratricopeptide (TPR) repeat protein